MQIKTLIRVLGLLVVSCAWSTAQAQTMQISALVPINQAPDQAVLNSNSVNSYVTVRFKWAALQPNDPNSQAVKSGQVPMYDFSALHAAMNSIAAAGKKIILRLNVNGDINVPSWLWNYTPTKNTFYGPDNAGVTERLWVYWDPNIQPLLLQLYQAISQDYQAHQTDGSFVAFCVAGLEGRSGTWAFPTNPNGPGGLSDIQQWLNLGYTTAKAIQAVQTNIDTCMAAFQPQVIISLSINKDGNPIDGTPDPSPFYVADQLIQNNIAKYGTRFNILSTDMLDGAVTTSGGQPLWPVPVPAPSPASSGPPPNTDAVPFWQYRGKVYISMMANWYVWGDAGNWNDNGGVDPGYGGDLLNAYIYDYVFEMT